MRTRRLEDVLWWVWSAAATVLWWCHRLCSLYKFFCLRSSSSASFSWLCVNIFCSLLLHLRAAVTENCAHSGVGRSEVWFCNSLDNHIITASSIWAICQKACLLECSARSFILISFLAFPLIFWTYTPTEAPGQRNKNLTPKLRENHR